MNYFSWILVCIALFNLKPEICHNKKNQYFFIVILAIGIAYFVKKYIVVINTQINSSPEWDFSWFWVYGKIAVKGVNFIDPTYAREFAKSLKYSIDFLNELDFPYLPPTIFLFVWLGYFKFKTAYYLWYILQSIFLVADVFLLQKIFFVKRSLSGLASILVLLLALPGTLSTFYLGQTHTLLLCLLLLFWQYSNYFRGGSYLALGVLVKPWLIFFLVYTFLRYRWSAIIGFLSTLGLAFILTILAFGNSPILSYFTKNPSNRAIITYIEPINQSLLATILRVTHYEFSNKSPLTHPLFIIISLLLLATSISLIVFSKNTYINLSIILVQALLIYPGTLAHYSIFLIIPILLFWSYSDITGRGLLGTVFFILLQYIFSSNEAWTFSIFLFDWILLAALCFYLIKKPHWNQKFLF